MEFAYNTQQIHRLHSSEGILPNDILHDSPRVAVYVEEEAENARHDSLDLLEEEHELALQRSAIYQQNLRHYHSRRVRHHSFKEGDLALHLKQKKTHKLALPCEGPFVVSKGLLNGSYYLIDIREKEKGEKKRKKRKRDGSSSDYEFA